MELSKGSSSEVARLKKELVAFGVSLKATFEANSVQVEALKKVESECGALRAKYGVLENEGDKLLENLKGAEKNLAEATIAHDQAMSKKL